jgi:hypothetical protein
MLQVFPQSPRFCAGPQSDTWRVAWPRPQGEIVKEEPQDRNVWFLQPAEQLQQLPPQVPQPASRAGHAAWLFLDVLQVPQRPAPFGQSNQVA